MKYDSDWDAFGDQVGWRRDNKWLNYTDGFFDIEASFGYLPRLWAFESITMSSKYSGLGSFFLHSLASRLIECSL